MPFAIRSGRVSARNFALLIPAALCAASLSFAASAGTIVQGGGASLPGELYQRLAFAYSLANSDVSVSYAPSSSGTGRRALIAHELDFSGSDSVISESVYADYPDIQMYPTVAAAVVPIYSLHLPAPHDDTSLVFSRETLVKIFMGQVTNWNDTAMQVDNPGVPLPDLNMTVVVRTAGSGTTSIWTGALSAFDETFSATIGTTSSPTWPMTVIEASGSRGLTSSVVVIEGAIGYNVLAEALEADGSRLRVGRMKNKAGTVVSASSDSVGFALMERGGLFNSRLNANLMDSNAAFAWPISSFTYLVIRKHTTRKTCAERAETVRFWLWALTDPVARSIAADLHFGNLPEFLSGQIKSLIVSDTLCDPESTADVVSEAPADLTTLDTALVVDETASISVYTSLVSAEFASLLSTAYAAVPGVDFEVNTVADQGITSLSATDAAADSTTSVSNNGTYISRVFGAGIANLLFLHEPATASFDSLPRAVTDGSRSASLRAVSAPVAASSSVAAFQLRALSSVAEDDDGAAVPNLRLSLDTIARVFAGEITMWSDAAIAAENPAALAAGLLPNASITVYVPEERNEMNAIVTGQLARASSTFATFLSSTVSASDVPTGWVPSHGVSHDVWPTQSNFVRVPGGAVGVAAHLGYGDLCMGFLEPVAGTTAPIVDLIVPAADGNAPLAAGGVGHVLSFSAEAIELCFAASRFSSTAGTFTNPLESTPPGCWPLALEVHALVPRDLSSRATANVAFPACAQGALAVEFLRWVYLSSSVPGTLRRIGMAPLPEELRTHWAIQVGLAVRCDGQAVRPEVITCQRGEARVNNQLCVPCPIGTYSLDTSGTCKSCPLGALCPGGQEVWAKPGFWQVDAQPDSIFACASGACCEDPGIVGACPRNSTARCTERRVPGSTMCGACREGFSAFGNRCLRCPGRRAQPGAIAVLAIGGVLFLIALINLGNVGVTGSAKYGGGGQGFTPFKVAVDFLQILATVVPGARLRPIALTIGLLDLAEYASEEWVCFFHMSPTIASLSGAMVPLLLSMEFVALLISEGVFLKAVLVWASDALYGRTMATTAEASRCQVRTSLCCGLDHPCTAMVGVRTAEQRSRLSSAAVVAVENTKLAGCAGWCLLRLRKETAHTLEAKRGRVVKRRLSAHPGSMGPVLAVTTASGGGSSLQEEGGPDGGGLSLAALRAEHEAKTRSDAVAGGADSSSEVEEAQKKAQEEYVSTVTLMMAEKGGNPAYLGSSFLTKYASGGFRLILVVFGSLLRTGLSMFACMDVGKESILTTQHAVDCSAPGHRIVQILAAIVVIALVVVLPLFLISVAKRELTPVERASLRGVSRITVVWYEGAWFILCALAAYTVEPILRVALFTCCRCFLPPRQPPRAETTAADEGSSGSPPSSAALALRGAAAGGQAPLMPTATMTDDETMYLADGEDPVEVMGLRCGGTTRDSPSYEAFWRGGLWRGCCGPVAEEVTRVCTNVYAPPKTSKGDYVSSPTGGSLTELNTRGSLGGGGAGGETAWSVHLSSFGSLSQIPTSTPAGGSKGTPSSPLALSRRRGIAPAPSALRGETALPLEGALREDHDAIHTPARLHTPAVGGAEKAPESSDAPATHRESGGSDQGDGHVPPVEARTFPVIAPITTTKPAPAAMDMKRKDGGDKVEPVMGSLSYGGPSSKSRRRRRNSALLIRTQSVRMLADSFSTWLRTPYRVWYEAWFFTRRALLIAVAVFVRDPLVRAVAIATIITILMLSSVHSRPLSSPASQVLFDISMTSLAIVAAAEVGSVALESVGETVPVFMAFVAGVTALVPILPFVGAVAPSIPKYLTRILFGCRAVASSAARRASLSFSAPSPVAGARSANAADSPAPPSP